MAYATLADLEARHPAELALLAADETTGLRDDARVELAVADASIEVRTILQARYSPDELARLDEASLEILKIYTMDIALYRVALSFSRLTDEIRERYQASIKRLEAIAAGKGALTMSGSGGVGPDEPGSINQNQAIVVAPGRVFTRERFRRL